MNILVISAHPDDVEINCAGTLKKFIDRGDRVTMCNLCNGDLGHMVYMPPELAVMRLKESKKSAAIIGAEHICADFGDLMLYHQDKSSRDRVVDVIRQTNPELIITHSPDDYMADHVAASKLAFDASFCASLPHYETGKKAENIVDICPIYYMDNLGGFGFVPTEYVNISDVIDIKLQMLSCHESQLKWMLEHDKIDFSETVRTYSRMRGLQAGVTYAEGFVQMQGWGRMTTKRLLP
jgi:LmbE family N-acetylglucosaminyl deacetylase